MYTWLQARHLDSGIGDYWTANITTMATSGRVRVRAVATSCGRYAPYAWEAKKSWFEPPNRATFLVIETHIPAGDAETPATAIAQFGKPRQTAVIGGYEVLVWDHNLLPAISSGFPPGCGTAWRR